MTQGVRSTRGQNFPGQKNQLSGYQATMKAVSSANSSHA